MASDKAPSPRIGFDGRYISDRFHGIGRHAFHSLEAMSRLDPNRRFVVYLGAPEGNRRFDLEPLEARPNVTFRRTRLPLYVPTEQLAWPGILAADRIGIFHSPYVFLPLLAPVRLVMTIHDLIFERHPEFMPSRHLGRIYRLMTRLGARRAAAVLTVSEASRREIEDYYRVPPSKLHVTYSGVAPAFQPVVSEGQLDALRRRYGLPARFLLTLGAGRPHKNVKTLVEALADVPEAPPLVVGGEADPRFPDDVAEEVERRGMQSRVIRPGRIDEADLPALYSAAEAFIFPSLIEGFGSPPLESMACGTPVIASGAASIPEVVGNAGLIVDARRASELANAVRRLLGDPGLAASLRERGLTQAQRFSWDRIGAATLAAYDAVAARAR